MDEKYNLLLIDPPWRQAKGGKKNVRPNSSGEELDYPVISLEEIQEHIMKATELCEENSVMFLWTIDKYLHEAEEIVKPMGWKLHARMVWNKVTGIPAAFTIRYGHEYLLYMYRGNLLKVATEERGKIHSVFTEQVKRHSQKPEISYQIIERLYPKTKKLEMYARNKRENWDIWGNELQNDVELSATPNQSQ
jgi:N6-adenosine-specific RNA methylase IME4